MLLGRSSLNFCADLQGDRTAAYTGGSLLTGVGVWLCASSSKSSSSPPHSLNAVIKHSTNRSLQVCWSVVALQDSN